MHIVTIDNFLICCSLETGGYVIGYLGAIFSMISIIAFVGLAVLLAVSYETLEEVLNFDENISTLLRDSETIIIAVLAVITLYVLFCFYTYVSLIIGTKNRNPDRLVPFLIVAAIAIVFNFALLYSPTWQNIINLVISTIIDVYLYICIYSLQVKFRNEMKYKFPESP